MAEILGLGLSHYPGPLVPAEYWPRMLESNVEKGRLPRELFEDRSRWPAAMLAEFGADNGISAARACRPPAPTEDAGMKPCTACKPRPGIGEAAASSSKLSMFISAAFPSAYWQASHSGSSIAQNFGSACSALFAA